MKKLIKKLGMNKFLFFLMITGLTITLVLYAVVGMTQKNEEPKESMFELATYEIIEDNSVEMILKKQVGDDIYILSLDRINDDLYHTQYDGKGVPQTIQLIAGDEIE